MPPLDRLSIFKGQLDPKLHSDRVRIDSLTGAKVNPKIVVISHTVGDYVDAAASFSNTGILQHFVIRTDGGIVQFVPAALRAWHAGFAFWRRLGPGGRIKNTNGVNDVNSYSIGITLVGNGCEKQFHDAQYESLLSLLAALREQFNINAFDVLGLGEVAHPPKRHRAPCALFDWDRLGTFGSTFPSRKQIASVEVGRAPDDVYVLHREVDEMLVEWGYSVHGQRYGIEDRVEIVLDRYIGVRSLDIDMPAAWRVLKQMTEFKRSQSLI